MSALKQKKFPHTFILLFGLVFIACLLTYLIPAGRYERIFDDTVNQTLVVPGSYQVVAQQAVAPWLILHKFYEAVCLPSTASLMWLILITGGAFEVIMQTGCLFKLCSLVLARMKGRELWIIPIFISLFSVFGFTMGMATASVVFVPLGLAAASTLGLDKLSGVAIVALGVNAGFTAGIFNPFSVGIAHNIAELPLFSGSWLRWVTLPILLAVTSGYIMFYAKRHRTAALNSNDASTVMTRREKISILVFVMGFLILTGGISLWNWETDDIVVMFLIIGSVVGLASGLSPNRICENFLAGCRKMMKGILVIGIAATMRLILNDGNILDTITNSLTNLVYTLPAPIQLLGIFFSVSVFNLLVTSGSTKAVLVMPILTPMADFLGLSRQATVYAFQLGDGLTNLASPISTTLNGVMAVSEITYGQWIRFYAPLVGLYMIVGTLLTLFASIIGY